MQPISPLNSTPPPASPYPYGNFQPVVHEVEHHELRVRGCLPADLSGLLLRNGPNPPTQDRANHWFLGDGMVHGIRLDKGRAVSYRNRYIRTQALEQATGLRAAPESLAKPFPQGVGNVNVIQHAGHILALGEAGFPYELDKDLQTLGHFDFAGALRSHMTAHPKVDPDTGELLFFGYDYGDVKLRYHVADRAGKLLHTTCIDMPTTSMMHDFGVTQTRVVHMDLPVVFDLEMVAAGQSFPFRFQAEHPARLGVMPIHGHGEQVQWLPLPTCYVFHVMNAYDQQDDIVMDVVQYDRTFVSGHVDFQDTTPRLVRWTIKPNHNEVHEEVLATQGPEFPRINPHYAGRPYRFGYTATISPDPQRGFADLVQYDLQDGTRKIARMERGRAAGEPVFVPCGTAENEGYVLSVVYDPSRAQSDLLVLDATRFDGPPVACVELPARIPFGFHGDWIPDA